MITEVRYLNETERILRESVERVTGGLERRNRQLGRRVGMFDDSVKIIITQLLSKLLVENGNSED